MWIRCKSRLINLEKVTNISLVGADMYIYQTTGAHTCNSFDTGEEANKEFLKLEKIVMKGGENE